VMVRASRWVMSSAETSGSIVHHLVVDVVWDHRLAKTTTPYTP
jgi:hypothetical protein